MPMRREALEKILSLGREGSVQDCRECGDPVEKTERAHGNPRLHKACCDCFDRDRGRLYDDD